MAINVTKPAINLREKLNEVTLETGIKGEELLNSDTSTEARNVLELDTHLFTDFESTGIDDNATSTAITIDASEGVTLAGNNLNIGDGTSPTGISMKRVGTNYIDATAYGGTFDFRNNGYVSRMGISASGNVTVGTGNLVIGTSGKGIDFSAVSDGSRSVSSNLLDDYEEGTWTPSIAAGGTLTISSIVHATYIKVGSLVTVQCYLALNNDGNTANLYVTGLPFTSVSQGYAVGGVTHDAGGDTTYKHARVDASATTIRITKGRGNSTATQADCDGSWFMITVSYRSV